MRRRAPLARRLRNTAFLGAGTAGLLALNGPIVLGSAASAYTSYETSRPAYEATNGHWRTVEFPKQFRVNAIHAVLLRTGKVLIVAGSGNNKKDFDAKTFRSVLWDPSTGEQKNVATPEDLFCSGHTLLPNGNVLIAGGTRRYETLAADVHRAAGVVSVKNESPDRAANLAKGTVFTAPDGRQYRSTEDVSVDPADKMDHGAGNVMVTASRNTVWVEAVMEGAPQVVDAPTQLTVAGFTGDVYGEAEKINFQKQEYQGLDASYEFDPIAEKYLKTGSLTESRWYPTLVGIRGGNVLAVSGLDQYGVVSAGKNEVYDRATRTWSAKPELNRYFPTYPSLFRLQDDRLFYSGSNAGYGPATEGRTPGIWDLTDNSFAPVPGLRDADQNETSSSVLLPPAQDQRVLIAGGGATGDKPQSTKRVDVVDLNAAQPAYSPGPDLRFPTRYLSTVTLPNDKVLFTGGSSGYRGAGRSDLHTAELYDPATNTTAAAAANKVGRNYHSEALLLDDGRVVTLGSDPLYGDKTNSTPGTFEQRVEIYEPPYLFQGARPTVTTAPTEVQRGTTFDVGTTGAVANARLIRPSAVTHVTDTEQRSVRLDVTARPCPAGDACGVGLSIPAAEGVTPSGWYMLFVLTKAGVPSVAHWVHVQ